MKRLIFIFLSILITIPVLFSQPKFIINLTGSFNLPMNELGGDPANHFSSNAGSLVNENPMNLYEATGFGFGGDLKYSLDNDAHIRAVINLNYEMYSNNYNVPQNVVFYGGTNFNPTFNILNTSAGFEYDLYPQNKVNVFLGLDLTSSFYNGKITFSPAPKSALIPAESDISSGKRYGLQINAGVDYAINETFGITGGVRLHFINLFGKNDDTTSNNQLIDGEHNQTISRITTNYMSMNLNSLNFFLGVSYYIMQPKKKQ